VVLGPWFELHSGVHGALCDDPPPGVRYAQAPLTCQCLFEGGSEFPPNPFDNLSVGDSVFYDLPAEAVVHSARLPVGNDVPWLADQDCLLAMLQFGQFFACGSEAELHARRIDWAAVRTRQKIMLARFLDHRCEGLIFWTEHARDSSLRHIEETSLLDARDMACLAAKSDVIHPALPPHRRTASDEGAISVICAGRTFTDKGGDIALAVFRALDEQFGARIRLLFVGDVPDDRTRPAALVVAPAMSRGEFLEVLGRSHVFFSPTLYESFGMALAEAASAGMAVVTSCGYGMEHVTELFADGVNAFLIPNELPPERRIERYVAAIARLVEDPAKRKEMGRRNTRLVKCGMLSVSRRNGRLLRHYERMWTIGRRDGGPPPIPKRAAGEPRLIEKTFSETYLRLELASRTQGRARRVLLPVDPGEPLSARRRTGHDEEGKTADLN